MTILKMGTHSATGQTMVEVYGDDGKMVGCIYPMSDGSNSIHLVSIYFREVDPIMPSGNNLPVPGYLVRFRPKLSG